jgi:hypothetical protein
MQQRSSSRDVEYYRCPTCRVGKVKVGELTRTNLLPEMAMPTIVPPEDPVLRVPSAFKVYVSEPAVPAVWLRVEAASVVDVTTPPLDKVTMATLACADWLTTSDVPAK